MFVWSLFWVPKPSFHWEAGASPAIRSLLQSPCHTHTHTLTHAYTQSTHTHSHTQELIHTHMHTHTHTQALIYTQALTHTSTHTHSLIYIHTHSDGYFINWNSLLDSSGMVPHSFNPSTQEAEVGGSL